MPKHPSASVIASDAEPGAEPVSWEEVRQRFDAERWYWVATAGPDGRPHVRPVLAVWVHDKVYSTTSPGARKGRNLQARPECSIAARAPAIDIVIEDATSWLGDRNLLEQIATAYDSKYGWPVTITDENMFDAPTAHRPRAPALPGLRDHPQGRLRLRNKRQPGRAIHPLPPSPRTDNATDRHSGARLPRADRSPHAGTGPNPRLPA